MTEPERIKEIHLISHELKDIASLLRTIGLYGEARDVLGTANTIEYKASEIEKKSKKQKVTIKKSYKKIGINIAKKTLKKARSK
jgi:hypothetical protein